MQDARLRADLPRLEVNHIHSFMSWVGGKKALCPILLQSFPLFYERYVECFGGAGWVLFAKPPGNDFEVYNDINPLLTNLFRSVQDKPFELLDNLRFSLNSRRNFDLVRKTLTPDYPESDVKRAAQFYELIRYSYASGLTSYGTQPHSILADFPLIEQAHRRLSKVVIECRDFEHLIRQHDRPTTFFYVDPPYYETEGYYQNIGKQGFAPEDHVRLRDALLGMDGMFLLSYNNHPKIFELYDKPGICIQNVNRLHNLRQRFEGGAVYEEYLIANYDLDEAQRNRVVQLNLFDMGGEVQ